MTTMEILEIPDADTFCNICYAEFLDPDDLSVHISQVHSTSSFKPCQFCARSFSDLLEYALHLRNDHLDNLKCCKYCNRVFNDYDEFRKHESKHYSYVAKSMYSCSQCDKVFNNISELERHEYKEHKNAEDGVFLNECYPYLSSVLNIKALKFLQSLGQDTHYICIVCEMSTPSHREYLAHLKINKCKTIVCNGCSSVYMHRRGLLQHLQGHPECRIGSKQRYKQCMECFKMFNVNMWRDHTKTCKVIKCRVCNTVFSSMYELSKHQTSQHPLTVMLEACQYCNREFAGQSSLEKHVQRAHKHDVHLYKYKCVNCKALFKHPKRLFAHFYSTHKDLEPYTCKICNIKFKIRKKFTIHIKLDHKSIGYIEFDENYHVFFSDKKSTPVKNEVESTTEITKMEPEEQSEQMTEFKNELDDSDVSKKVTFEKELKTDTENMDTENTEKFKTDFLSATETEGNFTEAEMEPVKGKRKLKTKGKKSKMPEVVISDSSDEDEPLEELRKRVRKEKRGQLRHATMNRRKTVDIKNNKKRFICNICKKYCYTFQNYHNHVALHYKNVTLKCVKCSETFTSKDELNTHCTKEHATSQLTETLKTLLEKRKSSQPQMNLNERFKQTIKKVEIPIENVTATLKEVNDANKLSVQKFIESFTPEDAPKKKTIEIQCNVVIKPVSSPIKESFINMTKCNLNHMDFSKPTLSMPIRYRQVVGETNKVTIKEVDIEETNENNTDYGNYYDDDDDNYRNGSIPEVAQEVMLEEEPPQNTIYIPHRVVLPNLPSEFKKIRIAHLQPEAPYYKIVKVEEVLKNKSKEEKEECTDKQGSSNNKNIELPDGTKLVTVNPLAHLLGDASVEKILEKSKNKYYQPKSKDFEVAIAKAMLKLERPEAFPKKKRKKSEVN